MHGRNTDNNGGILESRNSLEDSWSRNPLIAMMCDTGCDFITSSSYSSNNNLIPRLFAKANDPRKGIKTKHHTDPASPSNLLLIHRLMSNLMRNHIIHTLIRELDVLLHRHRILDLHQQHRRRDDQASG